MNARVPEYGMTAKAAAAAVVTERACGLLYVSERAENESICWNEYYGWCRLRVINMEINPFQHIQHI